MVPIEPEAIEHVLDSLANESLARSEAVDWSRQLYKRFGCTTPGGPQFQTSIKRFVEYWAVVTDALLNENCNTEGAPYYYRKHDFSEWLAIFCQQDLSVTGTLLFEPIRVHQCRFRNPEFILEFEKNLIAVAEGFGANVVRGLDDLDYYQAIYLQYQSGYQIMIENRPRMSLTRNVLQVDLGAGVNLEAITQFLHHASLTRNDITWMSDRIPELKELLL